MTENNDTSGEDLEKDPEKKPVERPKEEQKPKPPPPPPVNMPDDYYEFGDEPDNNESIDFSEKETKNPSQRE